MHCRVIALVASGAVGVAVPTVGAWATTSTSSMQATATVLSSCAVTATPLPFGNYTTTAASTANATIGVLCTNGTPYNVALSAGSGAGATAANRLMTIAAGTSTLAYVLYSNAALTSVWGDMIGTNTVPGTGSGLTQNLTVYGRIPSGQNVPPGAYADTVIVTLTY